MSAINERQSLITAIERVLSDEGWTPDENGQLPEQVGWIPSRIFGRDDGARIALEVEEEINIPRFLIRRIESCGDSLTDTRILVAAIRNTPLKITTARTGIEKGISVYADFSNPMLVLDSSFPERMAPISEDFIQNAYERFSDNKRVPLVLISELQNLQHVSYARDLRQFGHSYEDFTFDNWEDEHQFVHDFLTNHFGDQLRDTRLLEGLNVMSLLEEVSEVVLGKRPHFLHSFQTFLLGSVIIDKNYDLFQQLYSAGYETEEEVNIDIPWFFTSLFHDVASPFESIGSMGPVGELLESRPRGMPSIYVPHLLSCLFEALKAGPIDPEWQPEPDSDPGRLFEWLSRNRFREHGMIGALNLISSALQMSRRSLSTVIYPSALAVSIHNSYLWPQLVEGKLFPVLAKRFPLAFLLLLCDNIEEWGRETHLIESEEGRLRVLIAGLDFDRYLVGFNLWVDEAARAAVIKNRYDWITQLLFNVEDLQTQCTFSFSPSQQGV